MFISYVKYVTTTKRKKIMKILKWILLTCTLILLTTTSFALQTQVSAAMLTGINADKSAPTGDPDVSYPQISIRTNRTPLRTDLNDVVGRADKVASQFPVNDQANRSNSVLKELTSYFGSGQLGHAWIIIFNSNKKGDYTSYGYHEGAGYVKDGTANNINDRPDRRFNLSKTLPLTNVEETKNNLETKIIPKLNNTSVQIANAMCISVEKTENGVYTPINNCSWFAGNVWNAATGDSLIFEQDFDGKAHAKNWGMPFLSMVTKIADPGMIAESIKSTIGLEIKDIDGDNIIPGNSYYIRTISNKGTYYWITQDGGPFSPNWTLLSSQISNTLDNKYRFESKGDDYKIYSVGRSKYLHYYSRSCFYPNGGINTGQKKGSINWNFIDAGNNTYKFTADDGEIFERISNSNKDLVTKRGADRANFKVQFVKAN